MTQKLYTEMTTEEQLRWVQDFADMTNKSGERIKLLAKDSRTAWTADDQRTVVRLFALLGAWPFAQDFVEKAQKFGDYNRRVYRLPLYIEKVKEALADGLTTTDERGRRVAVVLPGVPMRRRGRPTKEEMIARQRGEVTVAMDNSPETRKRRVIAKMLGLEVVNGENRREKNNAELAQERAAREAEKARREPSLFRPTPDPIPAIAPTRSLSLNGGEYIAPNAEKARNTSDAGENHQQNKPLPSIQGGAGGGSVGGGSLSCAQLQSDAYELRMAQDKLHLNQLAPLCSEELQKRMATVQGLRVTAEAASERAKLLAEQGQPASAIESYAQQAKEATEAYLAIYADVDEELAVLHKRLYLDEPFKERFIKKHSTGTQKVNIETILHVTRPYYEKVRKEDPGVDARVKLAIETDNPEYAAKMKAEEEKKQEVSDLLRYLKRKDKPNVAQRIKTMEKRYARLVELLGEQEASNYRPIVDAAIEDYEAHYKKPDADTTGVVADGGAGKKQRGKKAKATGK